MCQLFFSVCLLMLAQPSAAVYQIGSNSNILFYYYPSLKQNLSYIALSDLPTPVTFCTTLSEQFTTRIFVKHDGMTGKVGPDGRRMLGGNKLRKLSYLLADAKAHGHDTILTFGCAGSNHAVQTAAYAKELGLHCICMLMPQHNAHIVRRNLLLQGAYGSELYFSPHRQARALDTLDICLAYKKQGKMMPYIIPTGGSVARGAIGYVEAAFELKEQIMAGLLPTPDHIYVTLGSAGTAAGLLLGCKAAGITSNIHLIINEPEEYKKEAWEKLHKLYTATNELLHKLDPSFAYYELKETDCTMVDGYTGTEYGLFTPEAVEAMGVMKVTESIELEGVYTGKCFTALLADLRAGTLADSNVLFWNTFCAEPMEHLTSVVDYRDLPAVFHPYFTEGVQLLDRQTSL
jgi:D-cysteine desulfhydrase